MNIRTMVNDLTIDGKEYPKGAKVPVDDEVGKGLVTRGLASEIKERAIPAKPEPENTAGKGGKK